MVEVINKNHLSNFVSTLKDLDKMTEVVILVRRYSSSALFEIACISQQVSHQILGAQSVFKRKIILAIIGYLSLFDKARFFKQQPRAMQCKLLMAMMVFPNLYLNAQ